MTTIDSRLSSIEQADLFVVNIKTAIITALRSTLDDQDYPARKIQGIKISMEFPLEEGSYPHIWVEFSFTKLQSAGIGHRVLVNNTITKEFYFEGNVRFTIMALTSYERDVYASQLMQLLAFGDIDPVAAQFHELITATPNINISFNTDIIQPEGQQVQPGTPWGTDDLVYQDSYSMQAVGQIVSSFVVTPGFLKKININAVGGIPFDQSLTLSESYVGNDGWQ